MCIGGLYITVPGISEFFIEKEIMKMSEICSHCGAQLAKDVFSKKYVCRSCGAKYEMSAGGLIQTDSPTKEAKTTFTTGASEEKPGMLKNPGKVVKAVAIVLFFIIIVAAIVVALSFSGDLDGVLPILLPGVIGGFLLSLLLYTFGDIACDIKRIADK